MDRKMKINKIIISVVSTYFLILATCLMFSICENLSFTLLKISIIPGILYLVYIYINGYFKEIKKTGYYGFMAKYVVFIIIVIIVIRIIYKAVIHE